MRFILILGYLTFSGCAKHSSGIMVVDSQLFSEECRINATQINLNFEHTYLQGAYSRWMYNLDYLLKDNVHMRLHYMHNELDPRITPMFVDIAPNMQIDTLSLQTPSSGLALQASKYFIYAKELEFGRLFFAFDFGNSLRPRSHDLGTFERYIDGIDLVEHRRVADIIIDGYEEAEEYSSEISLVKVKSEDVNWVLVDQSGHFFDCGEAHLEYTLMLNAIKGQFINDDIIAITTENIDKEWSKLRREHVFIELIYRDNQLNWGDSGVIPNYFDCIYYKMK